ncbi:hypothetical protein H3S84_06670 [Bartonella sp. W8098]|uniref:hypothetical protein n=1 Tax=Bartonella TaxID=773 RepID=UPI0018DD4802|nr:MULTISPECIES: hypothetical protein [Bartonella]MBH9987948.1 hypothetical protein [Bartonella apis]MBI0171975.1 hypothetical protein [Bartonella sp. W8151]
MVSVIIHANEDIDPLADTLAMLVSVSVFGLVSEVILWSENHSNVLQTVANDTGCRYLPKSTLGEVIMSAKSKWLLFLTPGARLLDQWREILSRYVEKETNPASFRSVDLSKTSLLPKFFKKTRLMECGLVVLKEKLIDNADNEAALKKAINSLRPVVLPIQIFVPTKQK